MKGRPLVDLAESHGRHLSSPRLGGVVESVAQLREHPHIAALSVCDDVTLMAGNA
jgi:hypothetical protein